MSEMVALYGFGGGGSGGTLTVTAPAGVTVTAAMDGKTKTKVAGGDGVAVFKGLATGQWTVSCTDGVQTSKPQKVTITADYDTTIAFFAAIINVTYPAGSACTATDGVTTLIAPDTSGTWVCVAPNAGDWVFSLNSGFRETVSITQDAQTETLNQWHLYKEGDQCASVTGGWTDDGYPDNKNSISLTSTHISANGTNGSGSMIGTNNPINCSPFSTLKVRFKGLSTYQTYPSFVLNVIPLKNTSSGSAAAGMAPEYKTVEQTASLSLSGLTGSYYIRINVSAIAAYQTNIYDIWMEV